MTNVTALVCMCTFECNRCTHSVGFPYISHHYLLVWRYMCDRAFLGDKKRLESRAEALIHNDGSHNERMSSGGGTMCVWVQVLYKMYWILDITSPIGRCWKPGKTAFQDPHTLGYCWLPELKFPEHCRISYGVIEWQSPIILFWLSTLLVLSSAIK